jgi:hypothetical protein
MAIRRTLIMTKVEPGAARLLTRSAKKSKMTVSAYCAVVLESYATAVLEPTPKLKGNRDGKKDQLDRKQA